MAYRILIGPKAMRELEYLPSDVAARIKAALRTLEEDPFTPRPKADIRRLHGTAGRAPAYRLRVGDYRVQYAVESKTVLVTRVFARGEGYEI
ncbi:MAG: type II toxin-antitoxin system RelE/ParE family toxin [Euryarchaeota archaeon]|nr:type II toxin-antitoxin system RelE/ParE family toxin [Euryarchaeota archaeon]